MKPSDKDILLSKNNAKTLLFRNAVDTATLKKETRMLQREKNLEERLFLKQREHMMQRHSSLAAELSPKSRRKELDINQKQMSSTSSLLLPEQSSPPRTRAVTISSSTVQLSDRNYRPVSSNLMKGSLSSSSSTSLPDQSSPPRHRVTISRSKTFSASDRRPMSHGGKSATTLLPHSTLSMSDRLSSPQSHSRRKLFADSASRLRKNFLTVSLPDINAVMPHAVKTLSKNSDTKLYWKGSKTEPNTSESSDEEICVIDDWEDLRKCRYLRTSSTEKITNVPYR